MMTLSSERGWRGVHLFFPAAIYGAWADRILLDVVEPFVRVCQAARWIDRWFFIRYNEHGPHLRFRLHGSLAVLDDIVVPAFERVVRDRDPRVANGLSDDPNEWTVVKAGEAAGHAVRRYAWVDYEPEVQRYGGAEALLLAETLFHRSSDFALSALHAVSLETPAQRLGRGLLAFLVVAHEFLGERESVSRFAHAYGSGYLRNLRPDDGDRSQMLTDFDGGFERQSTTLSAYVDEAWSRLTEGADLTDDLDGFRAHVVQLRGSFVALTDNGRVTVGGQVVPSYLAAASAIIPSYIHMTNNRLGISVADEAYLAHLIERTLNSPASAGAAAAGSETE